jgi:hypothetical protein
MLGRMERAPVVVVLAERAEDVTDLRFLAVLGCCQFFLGRRILLAAGSMQRAKKHT